MLGPSGGGVKHRSETNDQKAGIHESLLAGHGSILDASRGSYTSGMTNRINRINRPGVVITATLLLGGCAFSSRTPSYEPTKKEAVSDTFHGVTVADPYRWLENWSDVNVQAWSERQNTLARQHLDGLAHREFVKQRLMALEGSGSVEYTSMKYSKGLKMYLALKHEPPKQQPFLIGLTEFSASRQEKVLLDPNVLDATGATTIDWFVPSPDGRLLAVSLSKSGTEAGDVHVVDAATGKISDIVPRAHGGTAGGALAWAPDSKSFFYTRYPRTGDRPAEDMDFYVQVYRHLLGTPTASDRYEVGKDFPKIAEIILECSEDGQVLAGVQKGDGGEFFQALRDPQGKWTTLSQYSDFIEHMTFADKDPAFGNLQPLLVISRDRAPLGRISKRAAGRNAATVARLVDQAEFSIETDFFSGKGVTVVGDRMFVQYQAGGPSELRVFDLRGKPIGRVVLPDVSSVNEIVAGADGEALVAIESFTTPPAWFKISKGSLVLAPTDLKQTSTADFSDCEVAREMAKSKDGTSVPLNIIRRKGTVLDGNNATIVWGYGGYGVNMSPAFSPRRKVFLEQGGVFVVANIRGGGEFGEEWHRAGNLTAKQNGFDDFYAATKWMIDNKYTTRDRLAIMGGSNGGLLMGATMMQHPDLCKAVASSVGIYDMLRVELSANGAFNVTEFGTVKDPAQFRALRAYSPYHNVKEGMRYPNVLFTTGANDPRVDPMQSRKMTAALQAASPQSVTLLRTSAGSGHGVGASLNERIEQNADIYAFLFDQLGVQPK